jgi:hypothetical protein
MTFLLHIPTTRRVAAQPFGNSVCTAFAGASKLTRPNAGTHGTTGGSIAPAGRRTR